MRKRWHHTDEAKKKIGLAAIGNKHNVGRHPSEETRKKLSLANKGRIKSEATREKLSKANTGKKRTLEYRKWLSDFQKGKPGFMTGKKHSDESKLKMSLAKKGKPGHKMTQEQREALSKRLKGRVFSKEWLKKMSESHRGQKVGKDNPMWKGGTSTLSMIIRKNWKYRQWRDDVFTRDSFTCQECGDKSGNGRAIHLEAHHCHKEFAKILEEYKINTLEQALECEELWSINNGRTLCRKCHKKAHGWKTIANLRNSAMDFTNQADALEALLP